MSRGKKLLILALVLIFALGLYFAVRVIVSGQEKRQQEAAASGSQLLAASGEITGMSWTYLGKTVTLAADGDGVWYCPDEPDCPVDQSKALTMCYAAQSVQGELYVEKAEDLAQYGLDEPELSVTVTAGDSVRRYEVGDYNSVSAMYYMTVDGGNDVYLEGGSLEGCFWYDLENLVETEKMPQDVQTPLSLTLETSGGKREIFYTDEPLQFSYTDRYHWFFRDGESCLALDAAQAEEACRSLTATVWERCVNWRTDADLTQYGFDEPQAAATLRYLDSSGAEKCLTLQFGDYAEADSVYVRIADSAMVYTCAGTVLDELRAMPEPTLVPTDALSLEGTPLASVTLTVGEASAELKAAEAEELLASVAELPVTGAAAGQTGAEKLFSLTAYFDSGAFASTEMDFYRLDSASCLVEQDGRAMLASRSSVEALTQQAEALVK